MSVRIRMSRGGAKKKPFYRIVAADSRMPRDGRYLEKLGTYNAISKELNLDKDGIAKWIQNGASPSDSVAKLLLKDGFKLRDEHMPKIKKSKPKSEPKETESAAS